MAFCLALLPRLMAQNVSTSANSRKAGIPIPRPKPSVRFALSGAAT